MKCFATFPHSGQNQKKRKIGSAFNIRVMVTVMRPMLKAEPLTVQQGGLTRNRTTTNIELTIQMIATVTDQ